MPTNGPNNCSAAANNPIVGVVAWSDPNRVFTCDSVSANCDIPPTSVSEFLECTGFGFQLHDVERILGIEVLVTKSCDSALITDNAVFLMVDGAQVGNDKADPVTKWPSPALAVVTYGGSADNWGAGLVPPQVNKTTFGVTIGAQDPEAVHDVANIDCVRITITTDTGRFTQTYRPFPAD